MPERVVRLSGSQADDLAAICALGSKSLLGVVAAIEALPTTIRRDKIEEAIAAQLGGRDQARALTRLLFGLAAVNRRNFDNVESLLNSISIPKDWDDDRRDKWRNCRPAIQKLLSAESIGLVTKAMDLSFDVERFCVGARIITDIRPVFDLPRNKIVGSTIRQTLRMDYASLNGDVTSISVGLDADDIEKLKKACDEATHKVTVAKGALIKSGLMTEIIVPGEES